jgi:hypothetical protein
MQSPLVAEQDHGTNIGDRTLNLIERNMMT